MELKNKVILVTGGAQGLGAATVKMLCREGARVIAADINNEALERLKEEIEKEDRSIGILNMDVTSKVDIQNKFQEIIDEFGGIDVLINNAGIDITKSISDMSVDDFEKVVAVNLNGPFILSKLFFEKVESKSGHIVNITSTASKRAWANATAYHASKWGLLGFSHALHVEGREKNIKVTAIVAGGMRTPFILDRFPDTPLDVLQEPENVANVIRFILTQPKESVIPEVMILPMKETSWP